MQRVRSNGTPIGLTAASVTATIVGLTLLPNTVRIHWTLGLGPYYGPEFAPTVPTMAATTLAVALTALGGLWLADRSAPARARLIRLVTASLAGTLLIVQIGLVVVNA